MSTAGHHTGMYPRGLLEHLADRVDSTSPTPPTRTSTPSGKEPTVDPVEYVDTAPRAHYRLSWRLVVPTALVVLLTAGIATALLVWIDLHGTLSRSEIWQEQAFYLDEGEMTEGGLRSGRLMGLTIASAASFVAAISTPFVIGLYAYRIAHSWLLHSSRDDAANPTPLQYGLLASILGSPGLDSLFTTTQYLFRGKGRRARAPPMLFEAFVVCFLVYVNTHAVSAVDLWLHTVTRTILVPTKTPISTALNYGVSQSTCPPYPDPFYYAIWPCLYSSGIWADGSVDSLSPGMLATSNTSETLLPITLADASDLAVLVTPNVSQSLAFNMTTFGARASCGAVTASCQLVNTTVSCPGFGDSFPPFNWIDSGAESDLDTRTAAPLASGESTVYIQTANCDNCSHVDSSAILSDDSTSTLDPSYVPENSYSTWLQFVWASDGDTPMSSSKLSDAVAAALSSNVASMVANCTVMFYNISLSYYNGSYIRTEETLSNTGLSDGLAGPMRLGHLNSRLIADIGGVALSNNNSDEVMALLSQDLARLALGSAAVITNETAPTTAQVALGNTIIGRYPLAPVAVLLALLYLYAIFALLIAAGTLLCARGGRVRAAEGGAAVSTLELAKMRLTSAVALVAVAHPPTRTEDQLATLSAELNALDMFNEQPGDAQLGLQVRVRDSGLEEFVIRRRREPEYD